MAECKRTAGRINRIRRDSKTTPLGPAPFVLSIASVKPVEVLAYPMVLSAVTRMGLLTVK